MTACWQGASAYGCLQEGLSSDNNSNSSSSSSSSSTPALSKKANSC
jgi:hypothetical protein